MFLDLIEIGNVELKQARRVSKTTIDLVIDEPDVVFRHFVRGSVQKVQLSECDNEWLLLVTTELVDYPDFDYDNSLVFDIKNQRDIQMLNAFL